MNSEQTHENRCLHTFADGRRCRMLLSPAHPSLCPFHTREEDQRLESEKLARELSHELASLSGNFNNGLDINHVLGKVFKALAQRKISTRDANAFAYLAQLMLHSMRYVKNDIFWATQDADAYHRMVRHSIPVRELTHAQPKTAPTRSRTPGPNSPTVVESPSAPTVLTTHRPPQSAALVSAEPRSAVPQASEASPPLVAEEPTPQTHTSDTDTTANSCGFRSYAKPARKFHRMNRSDFGSA